MAFPYISEAGFEDGTRGHFDAETDTENRLDFPHYSELARYAGLPAPWRGAYCMRVQLGINDGTPADAYVQETGAWDLALGGDIYFRFMFYVSRDLVMGENENFRIFRLYSGVNTAEVTAAIAYNVADGFRIGFGETSALVLVPLTLGVWHCLELRCTIDSGASDGVVAVWLDGHSIGSATGLTQAAITSGVIGVLEQDAGTTRGTILFDDVIADEARIYPPVERFPEQFIMTASGHAFVGAGELAQVELLAGGAADNVLSVFDTDRAYTSDAGSAVLELKNSENGQRVPSDDPVRVHRGAYIALSGTNPRAMVKIGWANSYSDGAVRQQGLRRTTNPMGA